MPPAVKRKAEEAKDGLEKSVAGLRELLSNKDFDSIPEVAKLRERLDEGLSDIEESAQDVMKHAKHKAKKVAHETNAFVHSEPWPVLGAAVVLGAAIGYFASRR